MKEHLCLNAIDQVCRYAFDLRNGLLLSSLITNHPAHVFNVKES